MWFHRSPGLCWNQRSHRPRARHAAVYTPPAPADVITIKHRSAAPQAARPGCTRNVWASPSNRRAGRALRGQVLSTSSAQAPVLCEVSSLPSERWPCLPQAMLPDYDHRFQCPRQPHLAEYAPKSSALSSRLPMCYTGRNRRRLLASITRCGQQFRHLLSAPAAGSWSAASVPPTRSFGVDP